MENKYKIFLLNKLSELEMIDTFLEKVWKENNLDIKLKFQENLILDEIFTNIIKYGYDDELTHQIDIELEILHDRIMSTIIDDGREFNPINTEMAEINKPLEEREEGGLGIHMVKNFADKIEYQRTEGKNILRITKYLAQ